MEGFGFKLFVLETEHRKRGTDSQASSNGVCHKVKLILVEMKVFSLLLPLILAQTKESGTPAAHPDAGQVEEALEINQYIIKLENDITDSEWAEHSNLVDSIINGSYGYEIESLVRRFGLTEDIVPTLNVDPQVVKSTLIAAKGSIGKFNLTNYRGYHGYFPDWFSEILKIVPYVQSVEEDMIVSVVQENTKIVTDTQFNPQNWGLDRISHRNPGFEGRYVYPVNPGRGVDVYIVDTGVSSSHLEFAGRMQFGMSVYNDNAEDVKGHGTHVAGIAAGATYGVAKAANIISVKVLNDDGTGRASDVIAGIQWIINNARKSKRRAVVNLSLGGESSSKSLRDITDVAFAQGIVFAVAAGNSNTDACVSSPQDSDSVFTVAASDINDVRASFSNFGSCVDIFAPGTNITSASPAGPRATRVISGTSQAAPFVAGQMAIFLSLFPDATPTDVYENLRKGGTRKVLKDRRPNDVDLLLYNDFDTVELGSRILSLGDDFSFGGGGWTLIKQVFFSTFV